MPGPRAAAVAVMGMLAFGVTSARSSEARSVETLASAPLIVVGLATSRPRRRPRSCSSRPRSQDAGAAAPPPPPRPRRGRRAAARAGRRPRRAPRPLPPTPARPRPDPPAFRPVKHVFLIVLSDRGFAQSFGAGAASGYLGGGLRRQGELVQNYYAVAGAPLANEIALVSGQGPTAQTATDCPTFSRIAPGEKGAARSGARHRLRVSLGHQDARQSADRPPGTPGRPTSQGSARGARTACRVPKLGSKQAQAGGPLELRRLAQPVPLLPLAHRRRRLSPERGRHRAARQGREEREHRALVRLHHPSGLRHRRRGAVQAGARTGLAAANRFLKSVVPEIKRSAAYKDDGLIAITFDQAPQTGPNADPSACCSSPATYPNLRRLTTPPAVPPAAMGTDHLDVDDGGRPQRPGTRPRPTRPARPTDDDHHDRRHDDHRHDDAPTDDDRHRRPPPRRRPTTTGDHHAGDLPRAPARPPRPAAAARSACS